MELKRYWQIILRFWWVALLFSLAGAFNAYTTYKSTASNYQATFQVNIQRDLPSPDQLNTGYQDYFDYYRFVSTEYVVDDYTMVVKGSEFLKDVEASLKGTPYPMSVDELKGSFDIDRKHRELNFTVRAETPAKVIALTTALSDRISKDAGKYLATGQERIYSGKIVDLPTVASYNSGRNLLSSAIRGVIGVVLGLALVFLLAYLDSRLFTPADFKEVLEIPVLGVIPGKSLLSWKKLGK